MKKNTRKFLIGTVCSACLFTAPAYGLAEKSIEETSLNPIVDIALEGHYLEASVKVRALILDLKKDIIHGRLAVPGEDQTASKIEKIRALNPSQKVLKHLYHEIADAYLTLANRSIDNQAFSIASLHMTKARMYNPDSPNNGLVWLKLKRATEAVQGLFEGKGIGASSDVNASETEQKVEKAAVKRDENAAQWPLSESAEGTSADRDRNDDRAATSSTAEITAAGQSGRMLLDFDEIETAAQVKTASVTSSSQKTNVQPQPAVVSEQKPVHQLNQQPDHKHKKVTEVETAESNTLIGTSIGTDSSDTKESASTAIKLEEPEIQTPSVKPLPEPLIEEEIPQKLELSKEATATSISQQKPETLQPPASSETIAITSSEIGREGGFTEELSPILVEEEKPKPEPITSYRFEKNILNGGLVIRDPKFLEMCDDVVKRGAFVVIQSQSQKEYRSLLVKLTVCAKRIDRYFHVGHTHERKSGDKLQVTLYADRL